MIGYYPGHDKTYIVESTMDETTDFQEGLLYVDDKTERLYMYSTEIHRSTVDNDFFPIFNGTFRFVTRHSNIKYLKDIICTDMKKMITAVDDHTKQRIETIQMQCTDEDAIVPVISDSDNAFTQCIKGILSLKPYTLLQLTCMSKLSKRIIKNYVSTLTKISFMRLDRFYAWLHGILHMSFELIVYDDKNKSILSYHDLEDTFVVDDVEKYNDIINSKRDFLKKLVLIIMRKYNITKVELNKSEEVQEYTVNNMLILLSSDKPFSIQLFARFIRMIHFHYQINIIDWTEKVFEYRE